jgi:hypothetical protein
MGRFIFASLVMVTFPAWAAFDAGPIVAAIGSMQGAVGGKVQAVTDSLGPISKSASQTMNNTQSILKSAQRLNSYLGLPLKGQALSNLSMLVSQGSKYDALLSAFSGDGRDPLRQLNYISKAHGGADRSGLLNAKDMIQRELYPKVKDLWNPQERGQPRAPAELQQVHQTRKYAAEDSALTSMALAHDQKDKIRASNKHLKSLSEAANSHPQMTQQAALTNKLLEQVILELQQIRLLQAQLLDLQAKKFIRSEPLEVESREAK